MLEIFEGRLGGGKTYSACLRIESHLALGGHIFTNVELFQDAFIARLESMGYQGIGADQFHHIPSEGIARFYEIVPKGTKELPVLVVIDEAHIWLDQRSFNKKELDELFYFLTQSRKQSTDVIFISQSKKNLDVRIARLVQYVWTFRDLRKWRLPFFYFKWPFPHLVQTCWDYDGKTILLKKWLVWDSGIYKCYNTDAMLSDVQRAGVVVNKKITKENPLKVYWRKNMRILIYMMPFLLAFAIWKLWPVIDQFRHASAPTPVVAAAAPPVEVATAVPAVSRVPTVYHERLVSEAGSASVGGAVTTYPLETDGGDYEEGQPCPYGIVKKLRGRMAFIAGWDGGNVIVVAVRGLSEGESGEVPPPKSAGGGKVGLFGGGK
jgi:hypothetical protein